MHQEGILGVLGGMGPQATNTFYQRIIDRTQAESDQEHLRVLIWSDAKIPTAPPASWAPQTRRRPSTSICWRTPSSWRGRAARCWPSPATPPIILPTGSRESCISLLST